LSVECVIGLQWGDEGKGKIVDALTEKFDMVVRFAGGANAGHTVVFDGKKYILHLIPSGILHPGKTCVIGNGVVFDPESFFEEVEGLHESGFETVGRLFVSDRAHVVFPFHKQFDQLREKARGKAKIGTTSRGIGPCYTDKMSRVGIRVCELLEPKAMKQFLEQNAKEKNILFSEYGFEKINVDSALEEAVEYGKKLKPYIRQTRPVISDALKAGQSVLFEGAQGALLDIDHGTYPYVTSSSTGLDGINAGTGVPVRKIDRVLGVVKAYCTRVGDGPFPTEEPGPAGEHLQQKGGEFGATTGRPRRCGWLDLVSIRYTAAVNDVDSIVLTKLDVLDELEEIKVATSYEYGGREITEFPTSLEVLRGAKPKYEVFEGWQADTTGARNPEDLPEATAKYLKAVTKLSGLPIAVVSVGVSRKQTIHMNP
jgi:adenylosuccinate synthase